MEPESNLILGGGDREVADSPVYERYVTPIIQIE